MVDEPGVLVGVVVTDAKPPAVWPVIVTLPVTAMASAGMLPTPATANVLGVLALKMPVTPTLLRLSSDPQWSDRDVRRAAGLELRDLRLPVVPAGGELVRLPDGVRNLRVLRHTDEVAPALAGEGATDAVGDLMESPQGIGRIRGELIRGL